MEKTKTPSGRNKTSVVSLIAGIVSVTSWLLMLLGLFTPYLGTIFMENGMIFNTTRISGIAAITAIAAGIVSLLQIRKSGEAGKGIAIIGIILGIPVCLIFLSGWIMR